MENLISWETEDKEISTLDTGAESEEWNVIRIDSVMQVYDYDTCYDLVNSKQVQHYETKTYLRDTITSKAYF